MYTCIHCYIADTSLQKMRSTLALKTKAQVKSFGSTTYEDVINLIGVVQNI